LFVVVVEEEVSFQTKTLESYEHDARMEPKDGWAQDICQMGAVWLFGCVVDVVVVVLVSRRRRNWVGEGSKWR
jgi:hypothetical protein